MWYIATLVPLGVQRILFLPGSSKGLIHFVTVLCREFVSGNLFISLGLRVVSSLFANVKVSGGQELAQPEENPRS